MNKSSLEVSLQLILSLKITDILLFEMPWKSAFLVSEAIVVLRETTSRLNVMTNIH